jgi:hypothetical protein
MHRADSRGRRRESDNRCYVEYWVAVGALKRAKTVCTGVPLSLLGACDCGRPDSNLNGSTPTMCGVRSGARSATGCVLHGSMTVCALVGSVSSVQPGAARARRLPTCTCRLVARALGAFGRSRWMANRHAAPRTACSWPLGTRCAFSLASGRQISRPRPASGVIRSHGNGRRLVAAGSELIF